MTFTLGEYLAEPMTGLERTPWPAQGDTLPMFELQISQAPYGRLSSPFLTQGETDG